MKGRATKTTKLRVRMSPGLKRRVGIAARAEDESASELVRRVVRTEVDDILEELNQEREEWDD